MPLVDGVLLSVGEGADSLPTLDGAALAWECRDDGDGSLRASELPDWPTLLPTGEGMEDAPGLVESPELTTGDVDAALPLDGTSVLESSLPDFADLELSADTTLLPAVDDASLSILDGTSDGALLAAADDVPLPALKELTPDGCDDADTAL